MAKTVKSLKVLIVCTGNICRSPTAEALLRHHLRLAGLGDRVALDSAGIEDFHVGQSPSESAMICAAERGYDISALRARALRQQDFLDFDLILAMDEGHRRELLSLSPADARCRIALFLEVLPEAGRDVADPYYGTRDDYEAMLDLIELATAPWIEAFRRDLLTGDGFRA